MVKTINILENVILLGEKEILNSLEFIEEKAGSYKEFIEKVYEGDSKQFKEDLYYTLVNVNQLDCVTDEFEITNEDGVVINYRKFINLLKKKMWN